MPPVPADSPSPLIACAVVRADRRRPRRPRGSMYNRAQEREEALRPALDAPHPVRGHRRGPEGHRGLRAARRRAPGKRIHATTRSGRPRGSRPTCGHMTGEDADRVRAVGFYQRRSGGYPVQLARRPRARPEAGPPAAREGAAVGTPLQAPPRARGPRHPGARRLTPFTVRATSRPPPASRRRPGRRRAPATARRTARATHHATSSVWRCARRASTRHHRARSRGQRTTTSASAIPTACSWTCAAPGPGPACVATQTFKDGAVRQIRVGQRPDDSTRVVLEVDGAARHSVFALYDPFRARDRLRAAAAAERPPLDTGRSSRCPPSTARVPMPAPAPCDRLDADRRRPAHRRGAPSSARRRGHAESVSPPTRRRRRCPREAPDAITDAGRGRADVARGTPSVNLEGRFSLSRQLGLGIARVVIDPGHGGPRPRRAGERARRSRARARRGAAARAAAAEAAGSGGGAHAAHRRVHPARGAHRDRQPRGAPTCSCRFTPTPSRNPKARGVETYFLNFASNPDAQAVAARENAASGAHHAQPAGYRESDHAQQQAGRVARLRDDGAARDDRAAAGSTRACATSA